MEPRFISIYAVGAGQVIFPMPFQRQRRWLANSLASSTERWILIGFGENSLLVYHTKDTLYSNSEPSTPIV